MKNRSIRPTKKKKFYAVAVGRQVGVYNTWTECERHVKHFSGALFQSFPTLPEAQAFVQQHQDGKKKKHELDDNKECSGTTQKRQRTSPIPPTLPLGQPKDDTDTAAAAAASSSMASTACSNTHYDNYWIVTIMFDGGARGNPGPGGAGAIVTIQKQRNNSSSSSSNTTAATTTIRIRHFLGNCTNNEAEYSGLCQGLESVLLELHKYTNSSLTPTTSTTNKNNTKITLHIIGDSQLIIRQVKGEYKCHKPHLRVYLRKVHDLISNISRHCTTLKVEYQHVLRAQNTIADGTY
jgi:ribonuclease HI